MQKRRLPPIIGLTGYAQVGKDTVGAYLVENHGYTRFAFADKVKELTGLIYDEPITDDVKVAWRSTLQRIGDGCREVLGADVWIRPLWDLYWGDTNLRLVVTDVRYPNEADEIRAQLPASEVWRISRPGYGPANDHISEHAVDEVPFDRAVLNDGDLNVLYDRIDLAMTDFRGW